MLYYLPLESYVERYTSLMSCKNGWAENNFKKFDVKFKRIEGDILNKKITTGVVLDAHNRSFYAMSQLNNLIKLLKSGRIKDNDVIYTEDFWHPGIESLFYIRSLSGVDFKIGTFLHAQSVDEWDFTYSMKNWMRPIEQGFGQGFDYIFVTSKILKKLCEKAKIGNGKIYEVGLPYNSERLLKQLKKMGFKKTEKQKKTVIFSSRFDEEKNPYFFLKLVKKCPDLNFKLVKPRKHISNNKNVINELNKTLKTCNNLEIVDTSNKLDYYTLLSNSDIQFNCAYQDWVSWTLLEAVTFKCKPLYPIWRDFPLELKGFNKHLYIKDDLDDCIKKIYNLIDKDFNESLDKIKIKHNNSWKKYLEIMELI